MIWAVIKSLSCLLNSKRNSSLQNNYEIADLLGKTFMTAASWILATQFTFQNFFLTLLLFTFQFWLIHFSWAQQIKPKTFMALSKQSKNLNWVYNIQPEQLHHCVSLLHYLLAHSSFPFSVLPTQWSSITISDIPHSFYPGPLHIVFASVSITWLCLFLRSLFITLKKVRSHKYTFIAFYTFYFITYHI